MTGRRCLFVILMIFAVIVPEAVHSSKVAAFSRDETKPFHASENVNADLDAVLARARAHGKLALILMGGNWCPDSLGLLAHFKDPKVAAVLDKHYEKLLVDVGAFDRGAEANLRFGMPVIYGTPTVLIVDPVNEKLLNQDDLQQFFTAAAMNADDVAAYFITKADPAVRYAKAEVVNSGLLEKLYVDIAAFEEIQAKRIRKGFSIVGPMVVMEKEDRPDNFYALWGQLRSLRYQVPNDLMTLRATARRRVALGETDITLDFPAYPPLSWETAKVD